MNKFKPHQLKNQIGQWVNTPLWKEFNKKYMRFLQKFVKKERDKYTVYPDKEDVFRSFRLTSPSNLKCVVLGQSPYHTGEADGLAFSNGGDYQNISPSLKNIFKEVENDVGMNNVAPNPDLSRWAEQGVLLLNTCLTVREGEAESHIEIGGKQLWQKFTEKAIRICNDLDQPTVFMLWGNHAKDYVERNYDPPIDPLKEGNRVLRAYHPAAEVYQSYKNKVAFFGCEHFSKANKFLESKEIDTINW